MKVWEEKAFTVLAELGLRTAEAQLATISQQAAAESWSYTQFRGYLLMASSSSVIEYGSK